MNKDEPIIIANELQKIYRLYAKPHYRFLDMMGFLRPNAGYYSEHIAVNKLNLTIKAGEKVALIGRNGAGKSTLLKLISGVIMPTSGTLKVRGNARALLQIGTGFHADFTGRENISAYLAQLGVMGKKIHQLIDEIVDFSELEEYIDQPLKTYSTGMAARLMFATSTAVVPDLLILDEILSVGDAYFTQKSMDRVSELCDAKNTTLLLVSHDTYSAAKLVDRMIWIEKGQIVSDDTPQVTLKAYEDSIRAQEEQRLRKKAIVQLTEHFVDLKNLKANAKNLMVVEMAAAENHPQPDLVYFSEVNLFEDDKLIASIPFTSKEQDPHVGFVDSPCWGEIGICAEKPARPMLNYGSPDHKVGVYFWVDNLVEKIAQQKLKLQLSYYSPKPVNLNVNIFTHDTAVASFPLQSESNHWITYSEKITSQIEKVNIGVNQSGRAGSGAIVIESMELFNHEDKNTAILEHDKSAKFVLNYRITDPALKQKLNIMLVIFKDGIGTACRYFTESLLFDAQAKPTGSFTIQFDKLRLGVGEYLVQILIAKEGYFNQSHYRFYTLNPDLYFSLRGISAFKIIGGNVVAQGTPYVGEANWEFID